MTTTYWPLIFSQFIHEYCTQNNMDNCYDRMHFSIVCRRGCAIFTKAFPILPRRYFMLEYFFD